MSSSIELDTCRLIVHGPRYTVEVSVPAHLPLIDLLPDLLLMVGGDAVAEARDSAGWALQRLGEPPLDEHRSPSELRLRDGEGLHLRPRAAVLPRAAYDDVADGVAAAIRDREDGWDSAWTRRTARGAAAALAAAGLAALVLPGPDPRRGLTGLIVGMLVLAAGLVATRISRDQATGAALCAAAAAYAGAGGALVPGPTAGAGPALLAACATATAVALVAASLVPAVAAPFVSLATAGAHGALAGLLMTAFAFRAVEAATITLVVAVAVGAVMPLRAARLAGLRPPPLPTTVDGLQADLEPEPGDGLAARVARADALLVGFYTAIALVAAVTGVVLVTAPGWAAPTLAGAVALLVALQARFLPRRWHRLTLLAIGVWMAMVFIVALSSAAALAWSTVVAAAAAVALMSASRGLGGRRYMPIWGRVGDLTQTALALSVLPLAMAVLGVYAWARGLAG